MFLHVLKFWSGLILFWLNKIARRGLHFSSVTVYFQACARWNSRQCLFFMCQDDTWPQGNSFSRTLGVVFGQSFIGKIINRERSEDSSRHPIYLRLGESEGRADKNELGQLLIRSIDNVKLLSETWVFSLYQSYHETSSNQILLNVFGELHHLSEVCSAVLASVKNSWSVPAFRHHCRNHSVNVRLSMLPLPRLDIALPKKKTCEKAILPHMMTNVTLKSQGGVCSWGTWPSAATRLQYSSASMKTSHRRRWYSYYLLLPGISGTAAVFCQFL